jgi:hypothetical protein
VFVVPLADFSIEDPWAIPAACSRAALRRATDGETPRLPTSVAVYFDEEYLTVVFSGTDDDVVATYLEHDAPLYEEDVVELFLAPDQPTRYFEIEVNPLGTTFDAIIDSPDGVRATMKTDLAWSCERLFAAIRRDGSAVDTVIRVPFSSLGRSAPSNNETWRANFYRIDRGTARAAEFSAWCPTLKTPADFHVPAAFGVLRFQR